MNILVGVLVTIENEYNDCINSIRSQSYADYKIFEINNKPKNIAHDLLFSYFSENKDKYDILIKIDADMVIADNNLFKDIIREFKENKRLDRLFIPVFDHFVGRNLGGVNVYRNTVKWDKNKDNYFTDRGHKKDTIRDNKSWQIPENTPIIHHCPNPSNYQAFHFGLHRMMKALQPGKINAKINKIHWRTIRWILEKHKNNKTDNLKYALMGADCALSFKLKDHNLSYGDEKVQELYEMYDNSAKNLINYNSSINILVKSMKYSYPYDYWCMFLKYRMGALLIK